MIYVRAAAKNLAMFSPASQRLSRQISPWRSVFFFLSSQDSEYFALKDCVRPPRISRNPPCACNFCQGKRALWSKTGEKSESDTHIVVLRGILEKWDILSACWRILVTFFSLHFLAFRGHEEAFFSRHQQLDVQFNCQKAWCARETAKCLALGKKTDVLKRSARTNAAKIPGRNNKGHDDVSQVRQTRVSRRRRQGRPGGRGYNSQSMVLPSFYGSSICLQTRPWEKKKELESPPSALFGAAQSLCPKVLGKRFLTLIRVKQLIPGFFSLFTYLVFGSVLSVVHWAFICVDFYLSSAWWQQSTLHTHSFIWDK